MKPRIVQAESGGQEMVPQIKWLKKTTLGRLGRGVSASIEKETTNSLEMHQVKQMSTIGI